MPKVMKENEFREGRGYSIPEILKAGLKISQAAKMEIMIDKRRTSAHEINIEELKGMKIPEKKVPKKVEKVEKVDGKTIPLTEIKGIGPKNAEKLKNNGIDSANALANGDPNQISEKTGISLKTLEKYIAEAKKVI